MHALPLLQWIAQGWWCLTVAMPQTCAGKACKHQVLPAFTCHSGGVTGMHLAISKLRL